MLHYAIKGSIQYDVQAIGHSKEGYNKKEENIRKHKKTTVLKKHY
jgi:hypothetical protein